MTKLLLTRSGWCCVLLGAEVALAHGGDSPDTPVFWTFDPWITIPLLALLLLYAIGAVRIWQRAERGDAGRPGAGRTARTSRAVLYLTGWLSLAGALTSPLHWLGERLFTFHMIEHEIVMAVAAPLLVLARPAGALLWSLPAAWRGALNQVWHHRLSVAVWRWLVRPRNATALHAIAIWGWHVPPLFDAALADVALHRWQHLSFFLTALLFWWSMLRSRAGHGVALWHLFVTMVHTGLLGALIALAPRVLYRLQTAQAPVWGLTPLEDQQLAGIVMWVPAETVYAGAALLMAAFWIRGSAPTIGATPTGHRPDLASGS